MSKFEFSMLAVLIVASPHITKKFAFIWTSTIFFLAFIGIFLG